MLPIPGPYGTPFDSASFPEGLVESWREAVQRARTHVAASPSEAWNSPAGRLLLERVRALLGRLDALDGVLAGTHPRVRALEEALVLTSMRTGGQ